MINTDQLTHETLNDDKFEEEWKCVINTGGEYVLSKLQAKILLQEMANGNRGVVPFKTFVISIPYVSEFYRVRRFLKGVMQLPDRASELPYKPISKKKFEEFKKEAYKIIGRAV